MKLSVSLLLAHIVSACCISMAAFAQDEEWSKTLKFKTEAPLIKDVIREIEAASSFRFSYAPDQVPADAVVHLRQGVVAMKTAIDLLCREHKLTCIIRGKLIILAKDKPGKQPSLSGVVKDLRSGESLPGAQLVISQTTEGTATNGYGFFSLTRPSGARAKIEVKFMGYKEATFQFSFSHDSVASIALQADSIQLKEIVMTADKLNDNLPGNSSGSHGFSGEQIRKIPTFGGIADPLKAIQFLPGVQTSNEGAVNFSVRGGSFDQNLFLLDEAPVYNPSHTLSFFSVFNADAVRQTDIYKSAIPVRYGGRLSSVVDIQMREGNRKERIWTGAAGSIASQLMTEGPLVKGNEKISYMASARYSYAGQVYNSIMWLGSELFNNQSANVTPGNNKISFYDLNAKLNYRMSDRNHFYLSVYAGQDHFFAPMLTNGYALEWGNQTATFRWNHVHNPQLFSNTTAVFSKYRYSYQLLNDSRRYRWTGELQEASIKQDYDLYPNTRNHIAFGWNLERRWIDPGQVTAYDSTAVVRNTRLPWQNTFGAYVYVDHEYTVTPGLHVRYGIRLSSFNLIGPGTVYKFADDEEVPYDSTIYRKTSILKSFSTPEPRASITYRHGQNSLTLSYDRTAQFVHLLSNASVGLPTDMWMPSGKNIKPQFADQYALRFQHASQDKTFQWNLAGYWKKMYNTIDLRDNADRFANKYIESAILQGGGKAYGLEAQAQKQVQWITTNVSYTWSKVLYTIPGINQGKAFPTRFDKRHNLSVFTIMQLSKKWETSLNYVFTTGGAVTVPVGSFRSNGYIISSYYGGRNGYRLPDYHRLDLSVKYNPRRHENRKWKGQWSLDVYNVYGRKNPFMLYSRQADFYSTGTKMTAIYLFGIVPTLSYHFTF